MFGTTQRSSSLCEKNSLRGLSWCKLKKDIVKCSPNKFVNFTFFQGACVKNHFLGVIFTFLQGACVQRSTCKLQGRILGLFCRPRFGQKGGKVCHFLAVLQKAAFSGKAKALFLGAKMGLFWPKRALFWAQKRPLSVGYSRLAKAFLGPVFGAFWDFLDKSPKRAKNVNASRRSFLGGGVFGLKKVRKVRPFYLKGLLFGKFRM